MILTKDATMVELQKVLELVESKFNESFNVVRMKEGEPVTADMVNVRMLDRGYYFSSFTPTLQGWRTAHIRPSTSNGRSVIEFSSTSDIDKGMPDLILVVDSDDTEGNAQAIYNWFTVTEGAVAHAGKNGSIDPYNIVRRENRTRLERSQ